MSQNFIPDHAYSAYSPSVQNFGNYKTEKVHADILPSEGFSIKYDPSDDFIAIGCYNGTKLLYSAKESKGLSIQKNCWNPLFVRMKTLLPV